MVNRILSPHIEARAQKGPKQFALAAWIAVCLGIINITLTLFAETSNFRAITLGMVSILEIALAVCVMLAAAYRADAASVWPRRAWLFFAFALLSFGLGNTVWFVIQDIFHEDPFPSYADIFYLPHYLLFVAGLLAIPARPFEKGERLRLSLDMGVVMIASLLIFWTFLFGPIIMGSTVETTWLELIVTLIYPALDLVVLWVVFVLMLRQSQLSFNHPLIIPGLSVVVLSISDVVPNYQSITGTYVEHGTLDLLYSAAVYLMIWAGLKHVRISDAQPQKELPAMPIRKWMEAVFQFLHSALRYIPYLWISLAYGMLIGAYGRSLNSNIASWIVSIGVGLAIMLVIVRQIVAIKENMSLSRRLQRELAVREQTEQELRASQQEAIRFAEAAKIASEAKSTFLAAMSHEIRTPMNGVIGFTNLLADTPLSEEQRDFVQTIKRSGESLLTIINDILDYSKIEAGKLQLEVAPFDLRACCADVLDLVATQASSKGLELVFLADPEPFPIVGDVSRVRQILLNLISNAVKFTERGYVQVSLSRQFAAGDEGDRIATDMAQISIIDTGIGISSENLAHLFRRFEQADASTTRKYGGTGLGLAISKQLVELMGGQIRVESVLGQGSSFTVRLPAADAVLVPPLVLPAGNFINNARILVVDDLEVNRRMMQHLLDRWQLNFTISSSGVNALQQLRAARAMAQPFDLVIADHLMPGMTGEDLAEQIFTDPDLQHTPVILFSSIVNRGDTSSLLAAGFSAVLSKPLTRPSILLDAIVNSLAGQKCFKPIVPIEPTRLAQPMSMQEPADGVAVRARVLLAEDNAVNQKLARLMLEKLHCRVDIAGNGLEALQMVDQIPYDLVLMDCQMPEMDGYKATAMIRQREQSLHGTIRRANRHLPIIALTANAMEGDRDRCLDAGMDDYLAKPIKSQALSQMLDRWVANEIGTIDLVIST